MCLRHLHQSVEFDLDSGLPDLHFRVANPPILADIEVWACLKGAMSAVLEVHLTSAVPLLSDDQVLLFENSEEPDSGS